MNERYGCPDCGFSGDIETLPIQCPICGHVSMEHLHWTKGGDGSHWDGCDEVHWDCKIAKLESELARLREERRWIPVSEKPKTLNPVYISYVSNYNKKRYQSVASYIAPRTVLAEDFLTDECDTSSCQEYDDENDCYWVIEGWWEESTVSEIQYMIPDVVTHWMPLPQPPQERE